MAPRLSFDKTLERLKQWRLLLDGHWSRLEPWALQSKQWVLSHQRAVAVSVGALVLLFVVGSGRYLRACPAATSCVRSAKCPRRPRYTTSIIGRFSRFSGNIASKCRWRRCRRTCARPLSPSKTSGSKTIRDFDLVRILGAAWADISRRAQAPRAEAPSPSSWPGKLFSPVKKGYGGRSGKSPSPCASRAMYSKDEILELYLNKVYFGDGLYGAEAAARGYFGKSAADLDLSEAALLAGMVNAPSVNAPTVNMSRAVARRTLVLKAMHDQGIITKEAFERASKEKVALRDVLRREEPHGQYFKEEVRQQLVKQFGWERLSEGGLKVYTTIDPDMQRAAEANVANSLEQIEARRAEAESRNAELGEAGTCRADRLEAALVALDPTTGEVRAMVGGRDFKSSRFNRATQALRQPGSAFKPFVYAAALEAGYSPSSLVTGLDEPIQTLQGAWIPEDEHSVGVGHDGAQRRCARRAIAPPFGCSKRSASPRRWLRRADGHGQRAERAVARARVRRSHADGDDVGVCVVCRSGTVAARNLHPPRRGRAGEGAVRGEARRRSRCVSPQTAFLMTSMLSDVVNYGTAYKARQEGFTLPAAGKTGTTNDYVDAWFVGFTPQSRDRRVDWIRQAAHDHRRTDSPASSPCRCGRAS